MEELQDAIEDAQYMNAMNDSTPRPTKAWQFPTNAEVADYVNRRLSKNPRSLDLDVVCEGSLGFFMVSPVSPGPVFYLSFLESILTPLLPLIYTIFIFQFTQYLRTVGEKVFVEFLLDIAEFRVSAFDMK